jgi:general secretion pathway protein D
MLNLVRLFSLSCLILLSSSIPSYATEQTTNTEENITLNFVDVDIRSVIATISKETGKNFLIDPRVKGKLTIYSSTAISADALYDVFLSALRTHGYTAVEQNNVTHIVPLMEAKQSPTPVNSLNKGAAGAQQITQVVKLKNISAVNLIPVLRPLMPKEAYIAAYTATNLLILSDSEHNIVRIMQVIANMDKVSDNDIDIIPLAKANANQVLTTLSNMLPKKSARPNINISIDKRTNSILMSGDRVERERLKKLIAKLDSPVLSHSAHHVIYLKHASAIDLAPILDKIINAAEKNSSDKQGTTEKSSIIADEATNSIIVSAEMDAFRSLASVIKQLDITRPQVLIEAIIAEVSIDGTKKIGMEWGISGKSGDTVGFGGSTNTGSLLKTLAELANGEGGKAAAAAATGGFSGLIANDSFGVLINVLQDNTNFNILSAPRILTVDNKEAEIIVGENVPFVTGSYTTNNESSNNPFQTVTRKDIGLTLRVKPQINSGGRIGLEVYQEISTVKKTTQAVDLTTTKRSIKSNVLVNDGKILVLGGLMDDVTTDIETGIPWLMDIPYLGWLFQSQETVVKKRTLMVFLKPTILKTQYGSDMETGRALNAVKEEQTEFGNKPLLLKPDADRYQMPDFTPVPALETEANP